MHHARPLLPVALLIAAPSTFARQLHHVVVDDQAGADLHVKTTGDLNGDGFLDLVVASKQGAIHWYEERSAHPAWTRHEVSTGGEGSWSTDAECGDLDGDGDEDVVVSDWYQSERIGWFENLGGGQSFTFHPIGAPRAHDLELADFDGDGDLDIATRQQGADGADIDLWRNDGGATAWVHGTVGPSAWSSGEGLHAADLDGDGDPDLVVADVWLENTGHGFPAGSWSAHTYAPSGIDPDTVVQTGDVDGDGRVDIVTTPSEAAGGSGATRWFRAPQDPRAGTWTETVIAGSIETVTHSLGLADMDLDGDLDVVTAETVQGVDPDEVRVYWNEGGSGQSWTKTVLATTGSHSIRVIDVGGDGDFDVFGANWQANAAVDLWENDLLSPAIGDPFCIATAGCPCGNEGAAGEGCRNSTDSGARLVGTGTASVTADDLVLRAAPCAAQQFGLVVMSTSVLAPFTVGDGRLCLGAPLYRFPAGSTGPGSVLVCGPGLAGQSGAFDDAGHIVAGATFGFQAWYRDPGGPCGSGSNWSAGLEVTFQP